MIKLKYILLVIVIALGYFLGGLLNLGLDKAFRISESEQQVYTTPNMPDFSISQDYTTPRAYGSLVRLLDEKGEFFCSGTVISDDYVLTAAHCLMKSGLRAGMTTDKIFIKASNQALPDVGYAAALNQRADYALIRGNFTEHSRVRVLLHPSEIARINLDAIVSCGFPWGAPDICFQVFNIQPYYTGFSGLGLMYPGMSGGPVIDTYAGVIIGVNTGVSGGSVILSPLVGLFETLKVKVVE